MNVVEIEEAVSELAGKPFDPDTFFLDLIASYGAPKVTITRIRNGDLNKTDLEDAWLWRLHMHAQICATGSLNDSLGRLRSSRQTQRQKVRFILATDGEEVLAEDLKTGEPLHCTIGGLAAHFGFFLPIAGYERYQAAEENPVDIRATGRLAKLYDELMRANPTWAEDAGRHATNQFMTRVIFCLFAEDTGIFPDNLFSKTLKDLGGRRGEHAQHVLRNVFAAMATPEAGRIETPAWAAKFPYVNGGLFGGGHDAPEFTDSAFKYLISAGTEDWKKINPDIFGSMIQAVVDTDSRGELGLHYTSVPNILKVLDPLFLDDLREQLRKAWGNEKRLRAFLGRLSRIRVFDPACGSGNFLVIAYRELRHLEIEALKRLREVSGQQTQSLFSGINLSSFYGVELADFAAETAKLSLWVAEYQMNKRVEAAFGRAIPDLPLRHGGNIRAGNALQLNWHDICPTADNPEVETYIVGNPPYLGHRYRADEQRDDMRVVFEGRISSWGDLDYVTCWFVKGADFCRGRKASYAFVATNSICQGRQVSRLWPKILGDDLEIGFAHQSFKWSNNAAKNAAVICVIVGVRNRSSAPRQLFEGVRKRDVRVINPYLIEGPEVVVTKRSTPLSPQLSSMQFGDMPNDDGYLLLSPQERRSLLDVHPEAEPFVRRIYGSHEYINDIERYCLWISDDARETAAAIPLIAERIEGARRHRLKSTRPQTRKQGERPHRFGEVRSYDGAQQVIIVPSVSSERRPYLPVGLLTDGSVVSNLAFALYDAPLWNIGLIASKLHLVWVAAVCGKLKNDFRYSNTLGWHTFPVPGLDSRARAELEGTSEAILTAREAHFPASVAELYDPDMMPDDLRDAHRANDEVVERIYLGRAFRSDTERLEHLFKRYADMLGTAGGRNSKSRETAHA